MGLRAWTPGAAIVLDVGASPRCNEGHGSCSHVVWKESRHLDRPRKSAAAPVCNGSLSCRICGPRGAGAVSRDRHARAKELFLEAADLSPDEQRALLDRRCAGEPLGLARERTPLRRYRPRLELAEHLVGPLYVSAMVVAHRFPHVVLGLPVRACAHIQPPPGSLEGRQRLVVLFESELKHRHGVQDGRRVRVGGVSSQQVELATRVLVLLSSAAAVDGTPPYA